jgi:thiamine-monophosphate kinase
VTAEVEVARLPLSDGARAALAGEPALIETILGGGDDYEVLAAIPAAQVETFRRQAAAAGIAATEIGNILDGAGEPRFIDTNHMPLMLAQPSFSHF